jgi:signal transduction histidine kinase
MLATVTWLARAGGCILIGVVTFAYILVVQLAAYVLSVAVIGCWLLIDLHFWHLPGPVLTLGLGVMAVAAGVACTTAHGGALIGFSAIAALAAGMDTAPLSGWGVTAFAVLAVEVGAVVFSADSASILGYPLIVIVAFIGGRNRRAYFVQTQQSATLLTQLEALRAEQRHGAVLDERTRIAREIHDVLAHSLGALGIQIQVVRALLTDHRDIDRALGLLEQAQRMATDGLVETRRAVQALRGDTAGLDEQIDDLAQTHRNRHHASVDLQIEGQPMALTPEATLALSRMAQEALVNTAKHAPHQPVQIHLTYDTGRVRLAISNTLATSPAVHGEGSGVFSSVNGGYGLIGMRERLLLINGTLTAGSDQRCWTVTAQVPQ